MISSRQIRAARALALLGQAELAEAAGISLTTIKRIEASIDEIKGTARNILRIQRALEEAGIIFIEQDKTYGPGVRLRDREGAND